MAHVFESVESLEGVGEALAGMLGEAGFETVASLLQVSAHDIHAAVRRRASLEQVSGWRRMALLMRAEAVGAQWAEALVRAGITSLGELATKRPSALRAVFAQALSDGVIPSEPGEDDLAAMVVQATLLDCTSSITGDVVDASGQALADALVEIGMQRTTTDAKGRFHLYGIRSSSGAPLTVRHAGQRTLVAHDPPLSADPSLLNRVRLEMRAGDPEEMPAGNRLSELEGDELPPLQGHQVDSVRLSSLREGDLVRFRRRMVRDPDADLVSMLRGYTAGRYQIYAYRVPLDTVPSELSVGGYALVVAGALRPVEHGPLFADAYRKAIRQRALAAPLPGARSRADAEARFTERLGALLDD